GEIAPGRAVLEARPHPDWPLARVSWLLYHDRLNQPALREFAALPGLPESWRRLAERRLASGRTEDWTRRVVTPECASGAAASVAYDLHAGLGEDRVERDVVRLRVDRREAGGLQADADGEGPGIERGEGAVE